MKILFITPNLSQEWGGPTKVVTELTGIIAKTDIDVTIITTSKKESIDEVIRPEGVSVQVFEQKLLSLLWTAYAPNIKKILKNEIHTFDLIHIHGLWHYPQYAAYKAARNAKKPYIITIHGVLEPWALKHKGTKKKIFMKLIQRKILQEATILHAITDSEKDQIKKLGLKNHIAVIPNGIGIKKNINITFQEDLEKNYPILKGKKIILFLGRIHPKKGLDILVRSFNKIIENHNDVILVIAGPDNERYKTKIIKILKSAAILDKVIFTGMLNEPQKNIALNRADIFVLPSYSEGHSIAVLEAMASGLPVVITTACNFPEVEQTGAGIIIEPDIDQLTLALEKLLIDKQLRIQMGLKGKKLVIENYTWDKIAKQMINLYKQIIESGTTT